MDEEYCKGCSSFYMYLSTLEKPDKHWTPTCTITDPGAFVPISKIKICTMKNTEKKETYYLPKGYADSRPSEPKIYGPGLHDYGRELRPSKPKHDDWEYACMECNGKGYEEKLSCGCTGYRMIRNCSSCNAKGTVDLLTHNIQAEEHRKKWEEICKRFD